MKKLWLLPMLAMGISLGIYSCGKSASSSDDPQPRPVFLTEKPTKVSINDLRNQMERHKQLIEDGMELVIRTTDGGDSCTLQLVKPNGLASSR